MSNLYVGVIDELYKEIESQLTIYDPLTELGSLPLLWHLLREHSQALQNALETLGFSVEVEAKLLYPRLKMKHLRTNYGMLIRAPCLGIGYSWIFLHPLRHPLTISDTTLPTAYLREDTDIRGDVNLVLDTICSVARAIHTQSQCNACKHRMERAPTTIPVCTLGLTVHADCPSLDLTDWASRYIWCSKCYYAHKSTRYCGLGMEMVNGCSHRVVYEKG